MALAIMVVSHLVFLGGLVSGGGLKCFIRVVLFKVVSFFLSF